MMSIAHCIEKLEFDKVRQRVQRYATSDPGRTLLQSLAPSTSFTDIQHELTRVSELKRLLEEDEFPLTGVFAVETAVNKSGVEGTVLQPMELLHICSTLKAARILKTFVSKRAERLPRIFEITDNLFVDKVIEFNIDQAIDETGAVRASASKELQSIRRAISERYEQLRKRLESILKGVSDLGLSQEEIITTREGRMVIPVKAEHKNRVPGFIQSASASGATVFIEPTETLELNNDIRSLQFQEQREIERILRELTMQVGAIRPVLLTNVSVLARLDALQAKAKYSVETLGEAPVLVQKGPIKLLKARHPILMMKHGYEETIPLDLELGEEFDTLIISGPNAGGKSVALKCVGLLVLMVQAGLHIPASDHSIVRIFQRIFVDIGDEQSIENDLSTFSSHLANLKEIDKHADALSLVLIDEIGSGTDPGEGGAIAASLLESLTKRKSLTIATTHHGALKVFAHNTDRVENGAMEFDQETLTPTYRFRSGIPGSSYALEMAARLGISQPLLNSARERLGQQQTKLDSLITELEASMQKQRAELESLLEERARLSTLVQEYETKLSAQAKELQQLKRDAVNEARRIVERANSLIEQSIKEIRENSADAHVIKGVRSEIAGMKQEILQQQEALQELASVVENQIEVGDFVTVADGSEVGEVESISSDRRTGTVVFGNLKMKVSLSDLRTSRQRKSNQRHVHAAVDVGSRDLLKGIDLRGMTGDEALPLIDKFIDDAVLAGVHRIDIIHGKGTGALRKKVTDFLANHSRVKSYRLGEWNEGGTGATVVELGET